MIRSAKYFELVLIGLILILALIYRLDFLAASNFVIDADEGIVGLMAKHISEGREIPTFYYGQAYMGSLEPILVSGLFGIWGPSSALLKAIPLVFSLIFIVIVYALGDRLAGRLAGTIAAIYLAVPPLALLEWSTKARGGFIELICIGALALLCTAKWLGDPRAPKSLTIVTALLLGLGWWVNNQIIFFALPIGLYFLLRLIRLGLWPLLAHFSLGVSAFFVGGLPFWIYNIKHNFASFGMFNFAEGDKIGSQFAGLWNYSLPILLGGMRFWQAKDLFKYSSTLTLILLVFVLLVVLYSRRAELAELFRARVDRQDPLLILVLFFLVTCLVFALSWFGFLYEAPRYLLPLYAAFPILLGFALSKFRWIWLRTLVFVLVIGLNLGSFYKGGRAIPGEPIVYAAERVARDHTELINFLDQHGIRWIETNYWIGYRLAFETDERIRFLIFGKPTQTRIEEYREEGHKLDDGRMPLVLVPGQAPAIERSLIVLGVRYKKSNVGGYVVIHDLEPSQKNLQRIYPEAQVVSNFNNESAQLAYDTKIGTRWGSGAHQQPGMEISLKFASAQAIRSFGYALGEWEHDYPRGLSISFELEDGSYFQLLPAEDYSKIRGYIESSPTLHFYFPQLKVRGVTMKQLGEHPILDWSVAELEFFS